MQSGRWAEGALAQITTADFDVAIVGQLPATDLPLGDQFEPGPMQMVGFEATLRRQGTRTTPSYSPIPTPKMTQHRSDSHRASGGSDSWRSLRRAGLAASYTITRDTTVRLQHYTRLPEALFAPRGAYTRVHAEVQAASTGLPRRIRSLLKNREWRVPVARSKTCGYNLG